MEKITLYKVFNEDGSSSFTEVPQLLTNSLIYYRLTADEGYLMKNNLTGQKLQVALIPEYQLSRWVEEPY